MKDECSHRIDNEYIGGVSACNIDGDDCVEMDYAYCPVWEITEMICPCHNGGCGCTSTEVYVSKELETIYCPDCGHKDDLTDEKGDNK